MITRKFESNRKNTGERIQYVQTGNPSKSLGCFIGAIALLLVALIVANINTIMSLL